MHTIDQTTASCHVFTFREGMLSAVGHDLKLAVTRFSVEVDPQAPSVSARFDAASLRVVAAVDGETERSGALSDSDLEKIRGEIQHDVLDARRYPDIRFASTQVTRTGDGYQIDGQLTLHGQTRPLRVTTRAAGQTQVAEVTLHQPDYGIKPYKALLGALKVRADVRVRLELPLP